MPNLYFAISIPVLALLIAIGLSPLIIKRKYPVRQSYAWIGMIIAVGMMIFNLIFLREWPYCAFAHLIICMLILALSFAVLMAAGRQKQERKDREKS
jgi:hypothetical protein